jgi:hypothetical protein
MQRKGGGGVMSGGAVSRRDRGVSRKKCPHFDDAEVSKAAPLIKKSWARAMEKHGYFELGLLYYDTVFSEAQDIAPMFTLERERMGAKFIDMFGVRVPPLKHARMQFYFKYIGISLALSRKFQEQHAAAVCVIMKVIFGVRVSEFLWLCPASFSHSTLLFAQLFALL